MKVFPDRDPDTHMPFIFEFRGRKVLIFALREKMCLYQFAGNRFQYPLWKTYYTDWDDESDPIHPLNLKFPPESTECSATAFVKDDGEICLTLIARCKNQKTNFLENQVLYEFNGKDLDSFGDPKNISESDFWDSDALPYWFSGFRNSEMIALGQKPSYSTASPKNPNGTIYIQDLHCPEYLTKLVSPFPWLYRVCYNPQKPRQLFITGCYSNGFDGLNPEESISTIVYNFDENQVVGEILVDGQELYKSSLLGDEVVYVVSKSTNQPEEKELLWNSVFEMAPTQFTVEKTRVDIPEDKTASFIWRRAPKNKKPSDSTPSIQSATEPAMWHKMKNLASTGKSVISKAVKEGQVFASQEEKQRRIALCEACPFFTSGSRTCQKCGCYMDQKVKFIAARCPLPGNDQKW